MKKIRSWVALLLALTLCLSLSLPALAAGNDPGAVHGTAFYRSNRSRIINTVGYTFDESWFKEDPETENMDLAQLSMVVAASSSQARTAQSLLEDLGFSFQANHYRTSTSENIAYSVGVRTLNDGKNTPLVVIAPQSDMYSGEGWAQNMQVGSSGDHQGWSQAAEYVLRQVEPVLEGLGDPLVWVTGYSRGAAVANLLAARLGESSEYEDRVFAYTFECPATTDEKGRDARMYSFIHNYVDERDAVVYLPLKEWGFGRYGHDHTLCTGEDGGDDPRMLEILEELNPYAWAMYKRNPGTATVNGTTVPQFLTELSQALYQQIPSREEYTRARPTQAEEETGAAPTSSYQQALMDAARGLFSGGVLETVLDVNVHSQVAAMVAGKTISDAADAAKAGLTDSLKDLWDAVEAKLPTGAEVKEKLSDLAELVRTSLSQPDQQDGEEDLTDRLGLLLRGLLVGMAELTSGDAGAVADARAFLDTLAQALQMEDKAGELEMLLRLVADATTSFGTARLTAQEAQETSLGTMLTEYAPLLLKTLGFGGSLIACHHNDLILAELLFLCENPVYVDRRDVTVYADEDPRESSKSVICLDPSKEIWAAPSLAVAPTVEIDLDRETGLAQLPVSNMSATVTVFELKADGTAVPLKTAVNYADGVAFTAWDDMTVKVVDNRQPLADVGGSRWYLESVQWAVSHEVMKGTGSLRFSPETKLTRGTMAQILYSLSGASASGLANPFSDVNRLRWYRDAAVWASANGIMVGYPDGTFRGEELLTREQMVSVLYRFFEVEEKDRSAVLDAYGDASTVARYARPAMAWAVSEGIVSGTSAGVLSPKSSATRAQISSILMRTYVKPDQTLDDAWVY